jgi:hypothetical protein
MSKLTCAVFVGSESRHAVNAFSLTFSFVSHHYALPRWQMHEEPQSGMSAPSVWRRSSKACCVRMAPGKGIKQSLTLK